MAVQMVRAIPVPVYSDAVADELSYVLGHADVKFVAAQDQEQVDKVLSVLERLPHLQTIVYNEARGLRDYDHSRLIKIEDVIAGGRAALASDGSLAAKVDALIDSGEEVRYIDHTLHLRHDRHVERRRAVCKKVH